jgi:hypothetical protein
MSAPEPVIIDIGPLIFEVVTTGDGVVNGFVGGLG